MIFLWEILPEMITTKSRSKVQMKNKMTKGGKVERRGDMTGGGQDRQKKDRGDDACIWRGLSHLLTAYLESAKSTATSIDYPTLDASSHIDLTCCWEG